MSIAHQQHALEMLRRPEAVSTWRRRRAAIAAWAKRRHHIHDATKGMVGNGKR